MAQVLKHEHVIVRAEVGWLPGKHEAPFLSNWITKLIEKIDMKLLNGPHTSYVSHKGNAGWTGVAIIETSHVAIHTWNEPNPMLIQLDVYSCAKLPLQPVFDHLSVFKPSRIEYKFLDRDMDLDVLFSGFARCQPG